MKSHKSIGGVTLVSVFVFLQLVTSTAKGQTNSSAATVPVHMVVMVEPVDGGNTVAPIGRENVQVRQGKNSLRVTDWIPARDDKAGLQLFILIDDTSNTSLGTHLGDLRDFINAQAPTTWVGIGYLRNTTVNIVQNFTTDHAQAAKALRLPLGTLGASDSPYLSAYKLAEGLAREQAAAVRHHGDRRRGPIQRSQLAASAVEQSACSRLIPAIARCL